MCSYASDLHYPPFLSADLVRKPAFPVSTFTSVILAKCVADLCKFLFFCEAYRILVLQLALIGVGVCYSLGVANLCGLMTEIIVSIQKERVWLRVSSPQLPGRELSPPWRE